MSEDIFQTVAWLGLIAVALLAGALPAFIGIGESGWRRPARYVLLLMALVGLIWAVATVFLVTKHGPWRSGSWKDGIEVPNSDFVYHQLVQPGEAMSVFFPFFVAMIVMLASPKREATPIARFKQGILIFVASCVPGVCLFVYIAENIAGVGL